MKVFVTADPHFDHENIIKYCDRPFINREQMNHVLTKNWNSVVSDEDIVYVIGDFTLSSKKERVREILSLLKGRKFLVMGNHDYMSVADYIDAGFEKVYDEAIIINEFIILSHYPMFMTYHMPYFNVYGHVHNHPEHKDMTERTWCVSVERTNYTPVELKLEDNPQVASIERNYELEFFQRMYADLVISEEEAEATDHKYLTLEEIFENVHKIQTRLTNQYTAESDKQYIKKLLRQQKMLENDERYLQSRLDKIRNRKKSK